MSSILFACDGGGKINPTAATFSQLLPLLAVACGQAVKRDAKQQG